MMNNKITKKIAFVVIVFFAVSFGILFGFSAKVLAIDQSSINAKAAFEGVYGCFNSGVYRKTFYASDPSRFVLNKGSSDAVKLPYGLTNVSDNNLNCKEVMLGSGSASGIKGGLIPSNARDNGSDVKTVKNYFAGYDSGDDGMPSSGSGTSGTSGGIGYKAETITEGTSGTAKKVTYSIANFNCVGGEKNPSFAGSKKTITFPTVAATDSGLKITSANDISSGGSSFTSNCDNLKIAVSYYATSSQIVFEVNLNNTDYTSVTYTKSGNDLSISSPNLSLTDNNGSFINLTPSSSSENVGSTTVSDYKLTWGGGGAMTLLKGINSSNRAGYKLSAISAGMGYGNLALSKQEVYDLYTYYIEKVFGAKLVAEDQDGYNGADVNLCSSKKYKVDKTNASSPSNVYGVDSGYHFTAGPLSLDDIISTLDGLGTFDDINNGGKCNSKTDDGGDDGGGGGDDAADFDCDEMVDRITGNEGIGAMQWILCPSLNNTTYTADWIDGITENWLEVKADRYNTDSGAYKGWEMVRNVANVVMVVFLMIVIISQLTGRGIDNYGIKKMLPRLIMMAIIINLSFYICELAIDLSNIMGTGLRDMFGAFGAQVGGGASAGNGFLKSGIIGLFAAASGGGSIGAGAAVTAITVAGVGVGVAVLIAAIVIVLVAIVAIVILWLMLGAREVIIIFCVIISPLAFAAFILPNTQNLFKKWWELFKAAIIIFPICGAISGISYMLKQMSWDDMGVAAHAVLLVLPYLGFFLLPMLLKNALAALGKVGGALTSLGNSIRNGGRAIGQGAMRIGQQTEGYKNLQTETARRRQAQSSQRTIDRLEALKKQRRAEGAEEGKELTATETRRLARAHETQRKLAREDQAASEILLDKQYADKSMAQLIEMSEEAGDNHNYDQMNALHNVIFSRYGAGGAKAIADSVAKDKYFRDDGSGFVSNDAEEKFNAIRTNLLQNTSLANSMASKASDAYQMVSSGGYYTDDSGETLRGNIDMHSKYNGIMTQDKDRATQGGSTLLRSFASGAMNAKISDRMLNSDDAAIRSGILSDEKSDYLMASSMLQQKGQTEEQQKELFTRALSSNKNVRDNARAEIKSLAREYENTHPSWTAQRQQSNDALLKAAASMENAANTFANGAAQQNNNQPNGQSNNNSQSSNNSQSNDHTPTFDNGGSTRSSDARISDAAHDNPFMDNE